MIRLLVSDDSAFMRIAIRKMVEPFDDIQVVGEARTGQMAVEMVENLKPDVVTMDVEMPVMDGLEATKQIMTRAPTPIIMLSSLTERNSVTTLKALENGAVDFIAKKSSFVQLDIVKISEELVEKLRYWGKRKPGRVSGGARPASTTPAFFRSAEPPASVKLRRAESALAPSLVVLGISTGGPATLPQTLKAMAPLQCPMVVTQHMPPMFTNGFARHLKMETGHEVVESSDGMELKPGMIVIARGGTDVFVREPFPGQVMLYERTHPEAVIHPNADVLFRSAASVSGPVLAVVMTGMGSDGTKGAQELVSRKGSPVMAQLPESCIVDGMPSSVIQAGLATAILPPAELGTRIGRLAGRPLATFNPQPNSLRGS